MISAKSEGDFAFVLYQGTNRKQYIGLFCAEARQEKPLERMLEILDQKAAAERPMPLAGTPLVRRGNSWSQFKPHVLQSVTIPMQGKTVPTNRLFFPQQATYQDGLSATVHKKDKVFTVIGISAGGPFDEAAFGDFVNQLVAAPSILESGTAGLKTAAMLFEDGQHHLKFGHFREAIVDFQEVIRLEPENRAAYESLSRAYTDNNEYDKAEQITLEIRRRWPPEHH